MAEKRLEYRLETRKVPHPITLTAEDTVEAWDMVGAVDTEWGAVDTVPVPAGIKHFSLNSANT